MKVPYLPLKLPKPDELYHGDTHFLDLSALPTGLKPKEYARTIWYNTLNLRKVSISKTNGEPPVLAYPKMSWQHLITNARQYQHRNEWGADALDTVVTTLVEAGATQYKNNHNIWLMDLEHWPCKNEATLALWADSLLPDRYITGHKKEDTSVESLEALSICAQWIAKSPNNALGYPNVLSRCHGVWNSIFKKICNFNKEKTNLYNFTHASFLLQKNKSSLGLNGKAEFFIAFGFAWALRKKYDSLYIKLQEAYNKDHIYTHEAQLSREFQDLDYRNLRWQKWRGLRSVFSTIEEGMSYNSMYYWLPTGTRGYGVQKRMLNRIEKMIRLHPSDIEWVSRSILGDVFRSLDRSNMSEYLVGHKLFTMALVIPHWSKMLSKPLRTKMVDDLFDVFSKLNPIYPDTSIMETFSEKLYDSYTAQQYKCQYTDKFSFFIRWLSDFDSDYNEYLPLIELLQPDYNNFLSLLKTTRTGIILEPCDNLDAVLN